MLTPKAVLSVRVHLELHRVRDKQWPWESPIKRIQSSKERPFLKVSNPVKAAQAATGAPGHLWLFQFKVQGINME